jgi:long-chain acyl-CoA synthetase
MNLYDLFVEAVRTHHDKIAIVSEGSRFTYEELQKKVESFASFLKLISSNDNFLRFGLLIENSIDDIAILLAASKLNIEILTINPDLNRNQIDMLLKETGTRVLVIEQEKLSDYSDCIILGKLEDKVFVNTSKSFSDINSQNSAYLITASSGSTGNPKPIVFSQEIKYLRMLQSKKLYSISEDDVILNASGLYHSLGQRLTFLPLLNGCTLILLSKFNQNKCIKAIEMEKVTFTIAVSTHLHALSKYLLSDTIQRTSLKKIVSSSAAINSETKHALFMNDNFEFYEQYGASEVATVSNCSKENFLEDQNSVGTLCDGVDVEIHDGGRDSSNLGEIKVKTSIAFMGYMKEGSLQTFPRNSYFKTGDIGRLKNKFLFFHGRIQEVINRGGQNLYPQDIESYLLNNEKVSECKVIKASHPYFGEVPIAFISTLPGISLSKSEINSWSLINIPRFQIPGDYIFLERLPKLGSGKIDIIKLQIIFQSHGEITQ